MMEKCCKCGKEAILNEKGECFYCAEISGIKLTEMQKVPVPKAIAPLLFLVLSAINIFFTYFLFLACDARSETMIFGYIIIAIILTIMELVGFKLKYIYLRWWKPAVLLAAKYIIATVFGFRKADVPISGWGWQSIKVSFFFIVIWGVVQAILLDNSKVTKIIKENNIFQQMENRLSDIPTIKNEYKKISDEEIYRNIDKEIAHVEDIVKSYGCSSDIKENVIKLIHDRNGELQTNNETKFYYCKVIEQCMDESFRKYENGDWVNEIGLDIDNGFGIINDFCERPYVTKKLFELSQIVRKKISEPWDGFLEWEQKVGISQNFQLFRSESIGASLGEMGEQRVADELRPYEGQIIVLPNLRLEVEGESVENDFILISPYGVYVLEVKNLGSGGSYGLYIEKDGRWNKTFGNRTEYMESPVHQNERHILYLEKYINGELGRRIDDYFRVQGMVVLANEKVNIKNESDNLIVRYNNIMSTIRKQPVIMKENEMKQIAEILSKAGLEPKEYPVSNFFNCYINAKIFTNDYLSWKESTKELKEYVDAFRNERINYN